MPTRRAFLQYTATGLGAMMVGTLQPACATAGGTLLDSVAAACRRLSPLGWRQLLLDATGGELDLAASDLGRELLKPLSRIDRTYPGFGDFDGSGTRAIEPGSPDRSMLYHALASSTVVATRNQEELRGFPTLAEIEAVENYVYGATPPTMEALRERAAGRPLGLVVFAPQYRPAPSSVHGRHAELCFARAGMARLGTIEPFYDASRRNFVAVDPSRPFEFRVVPRRFAAYLAVQMQGNERLKEGFGPQDASAEDDKLAFWVPVHKLFSGRECIAGLNLDLQLIRGLRNDELAMFHRFLDLKGLKTNWTGSVLEESPFVVKDAELGSMSSRPDYGSGVLEPRPGPVVEPARYKGQLLTFPVDGRYTSDPANIQLSSLQVLQTAAWSTKPRYVDDANQNTQRPGPEYINIRHRVLPNGQIENLNDLPNMRELIARGGYDALHYSDAAGDGWVEARCPQLDGKIDARVPAYCTIGLPDFFPKVNQRELMRWWNNDVPKPLRDALWAIPPLALSQTRIAANITLPAGFSLQDVTVPAIVTQPGNATGPAQTPNGPLHGEKTGMPDGSPGLFDPGWDTSQGTYSFDPGLPVQKFMTGYGLGSPFIEDAKLCAALGSYWPGVAPDATRTFQPDKQVNGTFYPYPTIVPLTDEEIGITPGADGKLMPWDGVRGPQARTINGKRFAAYTDAWRTDYIDLIGTMTAALTSRIDSPEYKARIMAMAAVYWSLGIHDPDFKGDKDQTAAAKVLAAKAEWAVLSFRAAAPDDPDLAASQTATRAQLDGPRHYRFHVFRWDKKETPDPDDMRIVLVEMLEEATAYVGGNVVMLKRGSGPWKIDKSMPT